MPRGVATAKQLAMMAKVLDSFCEAVGSMIKAVRACADCRKHRSAGIGTE